MPLDSLSLGKETNEKNSLSLGARGFRLKRPLFSRIRDGKPANRQTNKQTSNLAPAERQF